MPLLPRVPAAATAADQATLVFFSVAGASCCVPVEVVERVLRREAGGPAETAPAASNAPAWCAGTVQHAGRTVPVLPLRERLGLAAGSPEPLARDSRLLVLVSGGAWLAAPVDTVSDVRRVDAAHIVPADSVPGHALGGCDATRLVGVLPQADGWTLVLDTARLLSTVELADVRG